MNPIPVRYTDGPGISHDGLALAFVSTRSHMGPPQRVNSALSAVVAWPDGSMTVVPIDQLTITAGASDWPAAFTVTPAEPQS